MIQEAQLSLTNRATHLCNTQWRGWLPKTRYSPRVLPRWIWSFCQTVWAWVGAHSKNGNVVASAS